jgi:hypothetical protein
VGIFEIVCRKAALALCAGLLAAASVGEVLGNNNLFLPGDAYFPTELTEADLIGFNADVKDPPLITYSSFGGYQGAFCGYAGYMRAKVPQLDDAFLKNLKKAYAEIREYDERELREVVSEDGTKKLLETNGIRVLFYPASFEFPKFKLGLRYNENWVSDAEKFGHSRNHLRLCSLIDDADAVMECWRDATVVAPLPADLPDVELKSVPETTAPVTLTGPLKAIVLNSQPLADYYRPEGYATVRVVDSDGIVEWSCSEDEGWEESQKGE